MPNNIAFINGKAAMAFQGATPWHRLGVQMDGLPDVIAAMKAASLDWKVAIEPLQLQDGTVLPETFRAVVRDIDREILGVVGSDYECLQNEEAFSVLQPACDEFGVTIETAGALGRGEKVWMLAKLPETIEPMPGDKVEGYFLIVSGHNGSIKYTARLTPIRVVCANTLTVAESTSHSLVSLTHHRSDLAQMDTVKRLVTQMARALKLTGETYAELAQKNWDRVQVKEYVDAVLAWEEPEFNVCDFLGVEDNHVTAAEKKRDEILDLVWNGTGSKMAGATKDGATAWAAYNAFTEWTDHVWPDKAKTERSQFSSTKSALFGKNSKLKTRALSLALVA